MNGKRLADLTHKPVFYIRASCPISSIETLRKIET